MYVEFLTFIVVKINVWFKLGSFTVKLSPSVRCEDASRPEHVARWKSAEWKVIVCVIVVGESVVRPKVKWPDHLCGSCFHSNPVWGVERQSKRVWLCVHTHTATRFPVNLWLVDPWTQQESQSVRYSYLLCWHLVYTFTCVASLAKSKYQ